MVASRQQPFLSLDHAILRAKLARAIADDDVLWLIDKIIASGAGVLAGEYSPVYFPGDDLFAITRPRGLPSAISLRSFGQTCI
jgi:RNA-directed DNA polymerase